MLIFLYPRFASGEVNPALFQATLLVMGAATLSLVFAAFHYYGASLIDRMDDAERARLSRRADGIWLMGHGLFLLAPSMVLVSVGLIVVGATWFALWFAYVIFAIRNFPRVRPGASPPQPLMADDSPVPASSEWHAPCDTEGSPC